MKAFLKRYSAKILGVLNGFDRLVLRGILRPLAVVAGMRCFLWKKGVFLTEFGAYAKGTPITLPADREPDGWIVHAGTRSTAAGLVTAGGRVLGAVGAGDSLVAARDRAYSLLGEVAWEGLHFRRDIAAGSLIAEEGNHG